jgi:alpha-ribazole phosphatase/probable phosphoglycerate mutase
MSTLIFIRHGETDMAGRFCGHSDPDINLAGELQVLRAAEEVAELGVRRIYSSDLLRAARTAIAIGRRIGVPVEFRDDLREINFGLWEGLNWQEIENQFPQEASRWVEEFPMRSAPGGESYSVFTARIDAAIVPFLCEAPGISTALVTHRGVMRYALTHHFGFTEEEAWTRTVPYAAVVAASVIPCDCEVML